MLETSWLYGLLGGLMIGLAGAALLLANGRIMGISGLFAGLLARSPDAARTERLAFIAGLVLGPALLAGLGRAGDTHATTDLLMLAGGGLLVGLGTRLGGGCTSGHGVCGLSRLSLRSLVATLVFMATGALTVTWLRHGIGAS